jgi:mannan polymerase II complex MNN10 subunit
MAYSSEIAVVTIAAGNEYKQIVSPGIENKKKYCELHGYDFIVCEEVLDPSRHPSWSKVLLLDELMENSSYKWLFWTDADSLIMNHSIKLEDLIDERYNMIITADFASICAGEFFLKKCDWSRQFLKDIYTHTECINHGWWEQCAMIEELKIKPSYYDQILILPQRIMNSFAKEVFSYIGLKEIYQPGDFIFHFAAARGEQLDMLLKKYST